MKAGLILQIARSNSSCPSGAEDGSLGEFGLGMMIKNLMK